MCYRPISFQSKSTGDYIKVKCNHCKDCVNQKSFTQKYLVEEEASLHEYCFFVTLTYDDSNVPTARLDVTKLDRKYRIQLTNTCSRLSSFYNERLGTQIIYDNIVNENEYESIKFATTRSRFSQKHPTGNANQYNVAVSCTRDFQLFLKRLRFHVYKELPFNEQTQIRYFLCTEYGPKTLRPHSHVLLFTNSEQVAFGLQQYCSKAWPFGRINFQLSVGKSVDYVSTYTTSSCFVPTYLKSGAVRPTSLHSVGFGQIKSKIIKHCSRSLSQNENFGDFEELYIKHSRIRQYKFKSCDRIIEYSPSVQIENSLFPRCYRYGNTNDYLRFNRYTALSICKEILGETNEYGIKYSIKDYSSILHSLYLFNPRHYSSTIKKYNIDKLLTLFDGLEYSSNIESTIYSILCKSSLFLRNCELLGISQREYYNSIVDYYNDKALYNLNAWYQNRQDEPVELEQLIYDYDNLMYYDNSSLLPNPICVHSLTRLADDINMPLGKLLLRFERRYMFEKQLSVIESNATRIFNEKIKHKKENDELRIFDN